MSALSIVGDLLKKVGALETKLASCRTFVRNGLLLVLMCVLLVVSFELKKYLIYKIHHYSKKFKKIIRHKKSH